MPKPDPSLLDPSRYPFTCRIDTRFADLDVNRHINNVAMAAIFEDARLRFYRAGGYNSKRKDLALMVASLAIEYLGEGDYPTPIDMYCAIEKMGRTSVTLIMLAEQRGQPIAFSRTVAVMVAPDGPAVPPAEFIAGAPDWMLRP